METRVEIQLQGDERLEKATPVIEQHVSELDKLFGRITACRVALKPPSRHHRSGAVYDVSIYLALPDGREVNVNRTPRLDERHADLAFALNDAFKRARRHLLFRVRRQVKPLRSGSATALN